MSAAIKAVLDAHAVEDYSDEYEDASLLCGCGFVARGSDLYDAGDSHREHLATVLILCGTDNPQAGTAPYFIGYSDLVDGYRHAWVETGPSGRQKMRRGRDFGHPADPRCPECQTTPLPPAKTIPVSDSTPEAGMPP